MHPIVFATTRSLWQRASMFALVVLAIFLGAASMMAGCTPPQPAPQGVAQPAAKSFHEQMAMAYGTLATVRGIAADLLLRARTTPDEARRVLVHTDQIRAGLDAALEQYRLGQTDKAQLALAAAVATLQSIEQALNDEP